MGLRMALKLQEVVRRIANQLNKSFSAMSATVALSPIPISDIYILLFWFALLHLSVEEIFHLIQQKSLY